MHRSGRSRCRDIRTDYGQSIARPLIMFALVQLLFCSMYLLLGAQHLDGISRAVGPALAFGWQQVLRPFSVWADAVERWPRRDLADVRAAWPFVLGTAQTLVSALCLYFLALGTRWRFRRW